MMNNYKTIAFFSGFPDRRFTDEIAERLGKGLPVRRCIAFITARPADYQQNDEDSAGMHGMLWNQPTRRNGPGKRTAFS